MHRTALLLLLAAAAQAQSTCPIQLSAQRQSGLAILTASDARSKEPYQGLHVTLTHIDNPPILSVEATLHGLSPNPSILPITPEPTHDVTKTFLLQRKPGEPSLASFDLWMSRIGALRWVDVTSITYADGTTWHAAQPSTCRAIPSLFVLVAGR